MELHEHGCGALYVDHLIRCSLGKEVDNNNTWQFKTDWEDLNQLNGNYSQYEQPRAINCSRNEPGAFYTWYHDES